MTATINDIKENLDKLEEMLVPRLNQRPHYVPYIYSRKQIDYMKQLLADKNNITKDDEKNIKLGIMSVKENLYNEDREFDRQISKLTWVISEYTGTLDKSIFSTK